MCRFKHLKFLIQKFHHLMTRKRFRTDYIDRYTIIRLAYNMVPNNMEEFGDVQYYNNGGNMFTFLY